jgi:hypothetical protein
MFKTFRLIAPAAAVAAFWVPASVPAAAQDIVIHGSQSFRDLEYGDSGADRIQAARAAFQSRIPTGTPIGVARTTLRKAGAHCPAVAGTGDMRCTYNSFAALEDHLQDVKWMIDVRSQDGLTTGLEVDRTTLGS